MNDNKGALEGRIEEAGELLQQTFKEVSKRIVGQGEMLEGMMERMGGDFAPGMPRKRVGEPAQLDSTLLYLCAPSSECVTGTIIKGDDGQGPR